MENIFENIKEGTEFMNIDEIKPFVIQQINQDLKEDILKNGMSEPLIIRKRDKVCIKGNQRLAILKGLGIKEVPVIIISPTIKEIRWDEATEMIAVKVDGYNNVEPCFDPVEIKDKADFKEKILLRIEEIENPPTPEPEPEIPDISEFKSLEGQKI